MKHKEVRIEAIHFWVVSIQRGIKVLAGVFENLPYRDPDWTTGDVIAAWIDPRVAEEWCQTRMSSNCRLITDRTRTGLSWEWAVGPTDIRIGLYRKKLSNLASPSSPTDEDRQLSGIFMVDFGQPGCLSYAGEILQRVSHLMEGASVLSLRTKAHTIYNPLRTKEA